MATRKPPAPPPTALVPLPPYDGALPRARPPRSPCDLCGHWCNSVWHICQMTEECRREYRRRHYRAGRILAHREAWLTAMRVTALGVAQEGPPSPCGVCWAPTLSMYGVCRGSYDCDREYRARDRAWGILLARLLAGRLDRIELLQVYAEVQSGLCPWCGRGLPENLATAHLDHIIPVIHGGPTESWNLQALHGSCNSAKQDKITPAARVLAAEHGIALAALPPESKICVNRGYAAPAGAPPLTPAA